MRVRARPDPGPGGDQVPRAWGRRTPAGGHRGPRRPRAVRLRGRLGARGRALAGPARSRRAGTVTRSLGATGNRDMGWLAGSAGSCWRATSTWSTSTSPTRRPWVASWWPPSHAAAGPSIVYTEHSLWNRMAVLVRVVNRAGIGLDRSLIAVSEAARQAICPARSGPRARVIVHGIDLAAARRPRGRPPPACGPRSVPSSACADDDVLAVTVANLRPEKGYDTLLDAARLVVDRDLPVWPSPPSAGARRRPPWRSDGERTRPRGPVPLPRPATDVLRLLVAADLFVLPSHQEGLPVVLMEATSVGLAIVATAVGGVPQVLTDGRRRTGRPARTRRPRWPMPSPAWPTDPGLRERLGTAARSRSPLFDVAAASRQIESDLPRPVRRPPHRPRRVGDRARRSPPDPPDDDGHQPRPAARPPAAGLRRRGHGGHRRLGARSLRRPAGPGSASVMWPFATPPGRSSPGQDLLAVPELARLFRRLAPDIVHTHNPKPGLFGRIAARGRRACPGS